VGEGGCCGCAGVSGCFEGYLTISCCGTNRHSFYLQLCITTILCHTFTFIDSMPITCLIRSSNTPIPALCSLAVHLSHGWPSSQAHGTDQLVHASWLTGTAKISINSNLVAVWIEAKKGYTPQSTDQAPLA
jgi:hypothetical protein